MTSAEKLYETHTSMQLNNGVFQMVDGTVYLGEPVYSLFTDWEAGKMTITFEDGSTLEFSKNLIYTRH